MVVECYCKWCRWYAALLQENTLDFKTAFYQVSQSLPSLTPNQGKMVWLVEKPAASPVETAALALAESHVRAALGFDPTETIDWTDGCPVMSRKPGASASAINWQNILTLLETYLPQILAILLPLLAKS